MRSIGQNKIMFDSSEIVLIERALRIVNSRIRPPAETGELIIYRQAGEGWQPMLITALEDGVGKSCAIAKVKTLIAHPEFGWGGIIPENQLAPDEKKWYGSVRLYNCKMDLLDGTVSDIGDIIMAFSDREEWQDVLYCAAVTQALLMWSRFSFDLPPGIENDPIWGTALGFIRGKAPLELLDVYLKG